MKSHRRARWRPKQPKRGMNKTESRFADWLQLRKLAGEISGWTWQPMKFRLGIDWKTTYSPDFLIERNDGELELVDVKGGAGWEEDARVKIKAAAQMYPQFHWIGYMEVRRNHYEREEFN